MRVDYTWQRCTYESECIGATVVVLRDGEEPAPYDDGEPRAVFWRAFVEPPAGFNEQYGSEVEDIANVEEVEGGYRLWSYDFCYPGWKGCIGDFKCPGDFAAPYEAMRAFDEIMDDFTVETFWSPSRHEARGTAHRIESKHFRCVGIPILIEGEMWCAHLRESGERAPRTVTKTEKRIIDALRAPISVISGPLLDECDRKR
jgi:hypothetical protein